MRAYVKPCYTNDATTARLKNVSDSWLTVTAYSNAPVYYAGFESGRPVTSAFDLRPKKFVTLTSDGALSFDVVVDWAATAKANAQQAVVDRLKALRLSPGAKYAARVAKCGQSAADLTGQYRYFEDGVRTALGGSVCVGLLADALRDTGTPPNQRLIGEETGKAVSLAKELAGGAWKDEVIHFVSRLHGP